VAAAGSFAIMDWNAIKELTLYDVKAGIRKVWWKPLISWL
jgi:hypothetical protein